MPPPKGATKEEHAAKARFPARQLESGADYLVICQVIKDDPKLLQAVSRELIAQGALTQVSGCLKIVDNSIVAAATASRGRQTASPELHHLGGCAASALRVVVRPNGGIIDEGCPGEGLEAREAGQDFSFASNCWNTPRKPQQKVGDVKSTRTMATPS